MLYLLRWACLIALLLAPTPPPAPPAPLSDYTSFVPVVLNRPVPPPPPVTESRYIVKTAPATMQSYGCKLAQSMPPNQEGYSLLLFGQPAYDTTTQEYGTRLLDDSRTFTSLSTIEQAAEYWADGFWNCTPVQNSPKITLLIGTSNDGPQVTYEHGQAWALMINRIGDYLVEQGSRTRIEPAAAINIELQWNTPIATRAWVDGYHDKHGYFYYNVGSCEGCPYDAFPDWQPDNGWTLADIWYVSWQVTSANTIPEIYGPSSAQQWQFLAKWAKQNVGVWNDITYDGVLTQYQACLDQSQDRGIDCKEGTKNTPNQGWIQFWTKLNNDPDTQQTLRWVSDIRWNY